MADKITMMKVTVESGPHTITKEFPVGSSIQTVLGEDGKLGNVVLFKNGQVASATDKVEDGDKVQAAPARGQLG